MREPSFEDNEKSIKSNKGKEVQDNYMDPDIFKREQAHYCIDADRISIIIYEVERGITIPINDLCIYFFPFGNPSVQVKEEFQKSYGIPATKTNKIISSI